MHPTRLAILLSLFAPPLAAHPAPQKADTGDAHAQQSLIQLEPAVQVAQRLAWWSEARFGLFIH